MTDFEEMVAFLEQECVDSVQQQSSKTERFTMKARFGQMKNFYVNFDTKKCTLWHSELKGSVASIERLIEMQDSNFKTHIDIQKELDKIL